MSFALLLAAYSGAAAALAPRLLAGARWPHRAPRLGVLAWLTLATTAVLAALLCCAILVVPAAGNGLPDLLHTSLTRVRHDYEVTGGRGVVVSGAVAGAAIMLRLGRCR